MRGSAGGSTGTEATAHAGAGRLDQAGRLRDVVDHIIRVNGRSSMSGVAIRSALPPFPPTKRQTVKHLTKSGRGLLTL
jgi:hypothetical protein